MLVGGAARAGSPRRRRPARCAPARRRRRRPCLVGAQRRRGEQEAQHDPLGPSRPAPWRRSRAGSRRCAWPWSRRWGPRPRALAPVRPRSTITSASLRSASSSSSGFVKAAWAGPRRPRTMDLAHAARGEHLEGVVGGVGRGELLGGQHEHPGHVERHVAVADDHRPLGREQVDLEVGEVRVAVVPADELGGRVRAGQLFAGDPQRPVRRRAGGVHDRVVALEHLLAGDVLAEGDVAEVAKAGVGGGLLVHARHRLDLRMVGRHARADQPPGGRQPLDHVHLEALAGGLQQVPGGVEAGRAGADDGDADGCIGAHRRSGSLGGGWARPDSNGRPPRCKRGALAS